MFDAEVIEAYSSDDGISIVDDAIPDDLRSVDE
jgi:hypothetical protein